jgi:hypothetical protein
MKAKKSFFQDSPGHIRGGKIQLNLTNEFVRELGKQYGLV